MASSSSVGRRGRSSCGTKTFKPCARRTREAGHFCSAKMPNRMCSVPTYVCDNRSASAEAFPRACLDSSLRGTSTDVVNRGPFFNCGSISGLSLVTGSSDNRPCSNEGRSLSNPSSICSGSMSRLPYWLASYRAKKITRLAPSVYRSNIAWLSTHFLVGEQDTIYAKPAICTKLASLLVSELRAKSR